MSVPKSLQNFSKIQRPSPIISRTRDVYRFGSFELIESQRLLLCEDCPVTLASKDFEVLLVLLKNYPKLVTKPELMDTVWPDSFVEEANLGVHVAELRKVLRKHSANRSYIQTVPKYGYRFIAEVELTQEDERSRKFGALLSLVELQKSPDDPAIHNIHPAEAILTLGGGLRIETRKRAFGTEITLAVPEHRGINPNSRTQRSKDQGVIVRTFERDGMIYITVGLDYQLSA